jgi:flagellar basal-body rod protein FlgB
VSIFATDAVSNVLNSALDGMSLRQNVIADNIANVDTPGFRARSVDFETSLKSAIAGGSVDADSVSATTTPTATPVGANGNNVDLRKETMAAMQTVYQYQMVSRSASDRLELMRTAVAG